MKTALALLIVAAFVLIGCETLQEVSGKWDDPIAGEGGQTWGDLVETIATVAVGFIPGAALVGVPIIRTARKTLDSVFRSVAAGGGPENPEAAKAALVKDARAYRAFRTWKEGAAVERAKARNA